MLIQFNFVQQCIQISTRINSSSVHTYIFVCFIRNHSNNPTITTAPIMPFLKFWGNVKIFSTSVFQEPSLHDCLNLPTNMFKIIDFPGKLRTCLRSPAFIYFERGEGNRVHLVSLIEKKGGKTLQRSFQFLAVWGEIEHRLLINFWNLFAFLRNMSHLINAMGFNLL